MSDWQFPFEDVLERHRARIKDHDNYIPFVVEAWRTGEDAPRLTTTVPEGPSEVPPRDMMLHAAKVMAFLLEADYLVTSYDTHVSKSPINPVTKKEWGPNEMQNLCDQQGFCETGLIRDELVVSVVRRADCKIRFETLPYHFHKGTLMEYPDRNIIDEWNPGTGIVTTSGLIPNALRDAMKPEHLDELHAIQDRFLPPEAHVEFAFVHQAAAAIRLLQEQSIQMGSPGMYRHTMLARTKYERAVLRGLQERLHPEIVGKWVAA